MEFEQDRDLIYDVEDLGGVVESPTGARRALHGRKKNDGPEGIGGWLLIPAYVPLMWGWNFVGGVLSEPGDIEIVGVAITLCALSYIAWMFKILADKRRWYPKLWVISYIGILVLDVIGFNLMGASGEEAGQHVARALPALVIWGIYFANSKRVRNTFVN